MEESVKKEIKLMLIPFVGIWWILGRLLPKLSNVTWWDYSDKSFPTILGLCVYQTIFLLLLKCIIG